MGFAEFTYQLLQAYDFLHLHTHYGCTLQIGGSDQWGNIITGIDLVRRIQSGIQPIDNAVADIYGLTTTLLTTSSGEKFGKSAGNAVWLDQTMTGVFEFYQVYSLSIIFFLT